MWPINVAKKRKLESKMINLITVLCIVGLFVFGISWLIALVMAYVCPSAEEVEENRRLQNSFIAGKDEEARNIDKLTQLAELHKQGVLTKEEFDAKKKQLLG